MNSMGGGSILYKSAKKIRYANRSRNAHSATYENYFLLTHLNLSQTGPMRRHHLPKSSKYKPN